MNNTKHAFSIAVLLWGGSSLTLAQSSAFTYQGRLADRGAPANGISDLQFTELAPSGNQFYRLHKP
jgi:hypothetical protein